MRAISPSRRHRPRASSGFSFKPVAVLLCAVLLVRLIYTKDVLHQFSQTLSDLTSNKSFAELALQSAGMPGAFDDVPGWTAMLLSSQSSALSLPPAVSSHTPSGGEDMESWAAETDASVSSAKNEVLLPKVSAMFQKNFWDLPTDAPAKSPPEAQPEQPSIPEADTLAIPAPGPADPGAKRVLEVTLTSPEGAPNGVYINNKTGYSVSVQDMLSKKSVLTVSDPVKPQVLIIHTHGSESFLPDERDYYIPTDIERTEDTRYNVVRLGDEMEKGLTALGLNVLHDREIYDSPSYSGSYGRSLNSIQKYIKDYPSIQVVIDIHRDSISASDGSMYKTVSQTDKGKAAQMMIVVGSSGSGLTHPNWKQNLSFACDLDKAILDEYPTLMRPVNLRKERFNQHATAGSIILEVGTAGNTLSEALISIELFCETAGARLAEQLLG